MTKRLKPGSGPLDYGDRLWLKILFAVTVLTLYTPILTLMAFSFNTDRRGVVWRGFTLENYVKAWNNRELQAALINSLTIAVLATVIATIIGTLLAIILWRFRFPGKSAYEGLMALPIVIPEICMGVALALFFASSGMMEGVVPLPGARELLESLPPARWTIVTSCTRALAEVRLRAAGLPAPEKFVTSTDVINGKPHPEPFLKGAKILGVAAGDCVVVEDAPAGIRAGKAAGARVIAFPTTSERTLLREAGADWVLTNCSRISVAGTEHGLQLQLAQEPV